MEIYAVTYRAESNTKHGSMGALLYGVDYNEVYTKAWNIIKLEFPEPTYFNHKVSLIKVPDTWIKQAYEETYNA
jgi:hypothetical protein